MKRDMDLVRNLLGYVEEKPDDKLLRRIDIEGYDERTVGYHLVLLYEAGLIQGEPETSRRARESFAYSPIA